MSKTDDIIIFSVFINVGDLFQCESVEVITVNYLFLAAIILEILYIKV